MPALAAFFGVCSICELIDIHPCRTVHGGWTGGKGKGPVPTAAMIGRLRLLSHVNNIEC